MLNRQRSFRICFPGTDVYNWGPLEKQKLRSGSEDIPQWPPVQKSGGGNFEICQPPKHRFFPAVLREHWFGQKSFFSHIQKTYCNLVMEYIPTTLSEIIRVHEQKRQKMKNDEVVFYSQKILEGLAYL